MADSTDDTSKPCRLAQHHRPRWRRAKCRLRSIDVRRCLLSLALLLLANQIALSHGDGEGAAGALRSRRLLEQAGDPPQKQESSNGTHSPTPAANDSAKKGTTQDSSQPAETASAQSPLPPVTTTPNSIDIPATLPDTTRDSTKAKPVEGHTPSLPASAASAQEKGDSDSSSPSSSNEKDKAEGDTASAEKKSEKIDEAGPVVRDAQGVVVKGLAISAVDYGLPKVWGMDDVFFEHTPIGEAAAKNETACPKNCGHAVGSDGRVGVRGVCNRQAGRCDCPYGWVGDDCSVPLMPHCTFDDGFVIPCPAEYMDNMPIRPCGCVDACIAANRTKLDRLLCYRDPNNPQDMSGIPEQSEVKVLSSAKGILPIAPDKLWYFRGSEQVSESEKEGILTKFASADMCQGHCSNRGVCLRQGTCFCFHGFGGDACDMSLSIACLNRCSRRGICQRGFCKCDPGHYGMDCSLPLEHNISSGDIVALGYPRIYVYDLPPPESTWLLSEQYSVGDGKRIVDPKYLERQGDPGNVYETSGIIYSAWRYLLDAVLASPYRVDDPEHADLFYIPAFVYEVASNAELFLDRITFLRETLRKRYPYWDRSGGRDHVWMLPGDVGPCLPMMLNVPELHVPIKISHFGRKFTEPRALGDRICHDAIKDIVVPNAISIEDAETCLMRWTAQAWPERNITFFFNGGRRPDTPEYSDGVRQEIYERFHNHTGFKLEDATDDYAASMRSSIFCLAPTGLGWGNRLVSAIINGCIPVIIQDETLQPFEGYLPYSKFSVRIAKSQIPRLARILSAIKPEQIASMQHWLKRVWRHFLWETPGTAADTTLRMLARSIHRLRREGLLPDSTLVTDARRRRRS